MYICPVCGYNELDEKPYDLDGNPSYEICSCCGFEFGFDDDSEGESFESYRTKWLNKNAKWFREKKKKENWNLEEQLKNINIYFKNNK
ncbi:hypothetical protein SAMN02745163_03655 [Clostridium cavendishii DSM 21758]|uniref:Cysteine-rich CPCC n=1 Tax=Clostridium cavendishii DSM 21758 TaxID=1121302 RepID=A0A1M6RS83_9CLOT|nr:hypothetical protein [Clostridium cavendishii]SHK35157.1 hypothetical protein SAMN02745163_03655 [Clostridium cavendishii DSM 21758]